MQKCITCPKAKPKGANDVMHGSTFLPILPYDCLSIDLLTPGQKTKGGHKHIMTIVDLVSSYGWFIPVKSRMASHLADVLVSKVFNNFGIPRTVCHDQAGEFTGAVFSDMLKELNIRQHKVVAYNPRSQGVVERLNQTLLQMLRAVYLEYPHQWDTALPMCQTAYNSSYHRSLNNVPYSILYPSTPHEDVSLRERVKVAQRILELTRGAIAKTQEPRLQNINMDKKNTIEEGNIVFCKAIHVGKKDYKILSKFIGPFRVQSLHGNCATVKALSTGRPSRVSLRNVKIVPLNEPFPVHGDNDFPEDYPHGEVKSHKDAATAGEETENLPDLVTKMTETSEEKDSQLIKLSNNARKKPLLLKIGP